MIHGLRFIYHKNKNHRTNTIADMEEKEKNMGQIKLPFNTTKADEVTIKGLIALGYLYVDENGIHVVEKEDRA